MIRKVSLWFATAALALGMCSAALAAVPTVIPFQGRLTDAAGTAINGSKSIRFSLWDAATAGTQQWFEVNPTVTVANGLFSVALGSVTALPAGIFTGSERYLEIAVGTDPAMTPRQRLGSVAYALAGGSVSMVGNSLSTFGFFTQLANTTVDLTSYSAAFPSAGYAVVHGYVQLGWSGAVGGEYNLNITQTSGSTPFVAGTTFEYHPADASGNHRMALSNLRVFPISAAGTVVFYLTGQAQSCPYETWNSSLVVEFFPSALGAVAAPSLAPAAVKQPGSGTSADAAAGTK